jgi:regulator of sirC expression with transglutaminase-like and TPR domain
MEEVPTDIMGIVLRYLKDDPTSVCRLEQSCRYLQQAIRDEEPDFFEEMLQQLWTKTSDDITSIVGNTARERVKRRFLLDKTARKCVSSMATDLRKELGEHAESMNGYYKVGDTWDHANWNILLGLRCNVQDALKNMANANIDYSREVLTQNLKRFFAARGMVTIQTLECLYQWKAIISMEPSDQTRDQTTERFSLLAVKVQMTPPALLSETIPIETVVSNKLDKIASDCLEQVEAAEHMIDKVQVLSRVLFEDMGFGGNEEDYYNYKNSLLNHVLETKKGIPITLAILYTCIARRLALKVDMIGLPGHLVLGFHDDLQGEQRFLDVFHGGRVLDLVDCQTIAASYGFAWHANFVKPLDPYQVFTRILNNLFNCHGRPQMRSPVFFHEMLSFQERALMLVHQQPRIAASVLDRLSHGMPLGLSVELLKLYGLLVTD